jgi:hypothetical protein
MNKIKTLIYVLSTVILVACGQAQHNNNDLVSAPTKDNSSVAGAVNESEVMSDDANDETSKLKKNISSSAAVENKKDTTHKFVRTANLKFKVKSVINSTYDIENTAVKHGGFVTYTKLESTINNTTETAISADSTLETTFFTVVNTIIIRVPNTKLDTTLKDIAKNIDYLDYRIIEAEDVALQLLSNNLTQRRVARSEQRLTTAIDNRGKKLQETTDAEELLINKQEQSDNARVDNLSIKDKINFSTITLELYQRQTIKRDLVSNFKNVTAYEQGFFKSFIAAIKSGWDMILAVLLFFTQIWGLLLFAALMFWGIQRFYKSSK